MTPLGVCPVPIMMMVIIIRSGQPGDLQSGARSALAYVYASHAQPHEYKGWRAYMYSRTTSTQYSCTRSITHCATHLATTALWHTPVIFFG